MVKKFSNFLILIISVWLISRCSTPTEQSGGGKRIISSHEIWSPRNNPIVISQDVTVTKHGTLEILPGTIIHIISGTVHVPDPAGDMLRNPRMRIFGKFICKGQPSNNISFKLIDRYNDTGEFYLTLYDERKDVTTISRTEFSNVSCLNGSFSFSFCKFNKLDFEDCANISLLSNEIGKLSIIGGKGKIANNVITENMVIQRDSLQIIGNTITNSNYMYGAIWCRNFSHSIVEYNNIENCDIAIGIFASTPLIRYNNIISNQINLQVIPSSGAPQADTVFAMHNWWGTTDSVEIANKITFEENHGTKSGKTIIFQPFLKEAIKASY